MNEKNICPQCGNPVSPHAPQGVCPACLAKANLGTGATAWGGRASGRSSAMPVEEVARLFPEMEVLELIGAGGMGAVYKARQPKLDRLVALKILHRDERDSGFVERFSREAKTLARLNHPNIVAVYEFGEREGLFFLIMELVEGATLRQLLGEGKMKPEAALAIVPPICEALQYAHEKGVVHRDIKPENILVDKEGRVKVADFGIARLAGTDLECGENLTEEGQVVGTALYMAPEQVERPGSVDHRADIYALGVVFYEMLTGELPLGRFPEPSKKVQVDVRLDEVVLKALEKEPERRYQQASEVRSRVEKISGTEAIAIKREAIQKRVFWPAIGLMAVAVLKLRSEVEPFFANLTGSPMRVTAIGPILIWGFAMAAIAFGGIKMMRLQSYGWAIFAAVLAMLLPSNSMLGLVVGVWTLVVLSQPEVSEAFIRRERGIG